MRSNEKCFGEAQGCEDDGVGGLVPWPLGVTDAGEFVYTPMSVYESFHVVYFDPKRKSIRVTKIKGIANDLYRRLKGLRFDSLNDLDVFPNNIERLLLL
ncbi:unnamed protein product [Arabidopsis thaliana]|uniref:(thale cress) hypothetical protein n=1 Tax=Arabidopsis thaliana TaxID=3702 RepID=A0A654G206_ARATH|nr:unnamed protein product [Arabidopsis thaliana]VYS67182.1 unnamed protein product [Arabidopsis thaliana]